MTNATRITANVLPAAMRLLEWLFAAQAHDESSADSVDQHARSQSTVASSTSPTPDPSSVERFRRIMLPQLDAAYNLARYLVRDPTSADDCVQEAYVRALCAFQNYRGGDARSWILTIVRNCCLTWLSSKRAEKKWLDDGLDIDALEAANDTASLHPLHVTPLTPDAEFAKLEQATMARELIAALSPPLREVLVLREMEELSYRQIAAIVDVPIGTVMSRLARARTQLATAYRKFDSGGDRT